MVHKAPKSNTAYDDFIRMSLSVQNFNIFLFIFLTDVCVIGLFIIKANCEGAVKAGFVLFVCVILSIFLKNYNINLKNRYNTLRLKYLSQ